MAKFRARAVVGCHILGDFRIAGIAGNHAFTGGVELLMGALTTWGR